AFVQGVGCDDASGSHFVVQDRVEHGESGDAERTSGGWIARMLRAKKTRSSLSAIAIGDRIPEALRGAPQATAMRAASELALRVPGGSEPAQRVLRLLYENEPLLGDPARATLDVLARLESLGHSRERVTSAHDFARGLAEIARLVHADVGLEVAC